MTSGLWIALASVQTPVFKGEEESRLKEIWELLQKLLSSEIFYYVVFGIGIAIVLVVWYNRRKDISILEAEVVQEDTWFITRDDNNRVIIVVSVKLHNKSTSGISIVDCKLSGYSARPHPGDIQLSGPEGEKDLNFPEHRHFIKGEDFYLGPYSTETLWFCYESRVVTMRNILKAPLIIKDSVRKRKVLPVRIPRHNDQIAIYREMAKIW